MTMVMMTTTAAPVTEVARTAATEAAVMMVAMEAAGATAVAMEVAAAEAVMAAEGEAAEAPAPAELVGAVRRRLRAPDGDLGRPTGLFSCQRAATAALIVSSCR